LSDPSQLPPDASPFPWSLPGLGHFPALPSERPDLLRVTVHFELRALLRTIASARPPGDRGLPANPPCCNSEAESEPKWSGCRWAAGPAFKHLPRSGLGVVGGRGGGGTYPFRSRPLACHYNSLARCRGTTQRMIPRAFVDPAGGGDPEDIRWRVQSRWQRSQVEHYSDGRADWIDRDTWASC
jgi:hypothetical protein